MAEIKRNFSLKKYNTFSVDVVAEAFIETENIQDIKDALTFARKSNLDVFILGEGSNLLFTENYRGVIIRPANKEIEIIYEGSEEILVKAGTGLNWDSFVEYCVNKNWYGAENLSLIPGTVGATPVQNIGAYGTEAKDLIKEVEVYDRKKELTRILKNSECKFAYRDSIFKKEEKDRFIVLSVTFKLKKNGMLNLDYGNVNDVFQQQAEQNLKGLRESIIKIRRSKLPDPAETGNAGSFFKNPIIKEDQYNELLEQHPGLPAYPHERGLVKIPAAWLIDKSGWKGKRYGDTGTWPKQALVLVNYGSATGKELSAFSEMIAQDVYEKFAISLDPEVTIISS